MSSWKVRSHDVHIENVHAWPKANLDMNMIRLLQLDEYELHVAAFPFV